MAFLITKPVEPLAEPYGVGNVQNIAGHVRLFIGLVTQLWYVTLSDDHDRHVRRLTILGMQGRYTTLSYTRIQYNIFYNYNGQAGPYSTFYWRQNVRVDAVWVSYGPDNTVKSKHDVRMDDRIRALWLLQSVDHSDEPSEEEIGVYVAVIRFSTSTSTVNRW